MPRFGFIGDEEVPSADSPPQQKMAATSTSPARHVPTSATQREESPPPKQLHSTEQRSMMTDSYTQRSMMTDSYTEHDDKAEIAPPEAGADLETLVEQEASRVADPHLMKEARDAAAYVEGEQKIVDNTVKAPVVGSEEDQYLLEEVAANWTT
eukprot:scaffold7963_cov115-Skeletonema_dohrnii-CCMP3373.AAC.2